MPRSTSTKGHTLVELLVAGALIAILVLVISQFYMAANDGVATLQAQSTLQMQLTQGQRRLLEDIRQAASARITGTMLIVIPPSFSQTFTCDVNTLCLTIPSITAAQAPIIGQADSVVYDLNTATGVLTRYQDASPLTGRTDRQDAMAHDLAKAVDGVTFQYGTGVGSAFVNCVLKGSRRERGRLYPFTLEFRGRLRNV